MIIQIHWLTWYHISFCLVFSLISLLWGIFLQVRIIPRENFIHTSGDSDLEKAVPTILSNQRLTVDDICLRWMLYDTRKQWRKLLQELSPLFPFCIRQSTFLNNSKSTSIKSLLYKRFAALKMVMTCGNASVGNINQANKV